MKLLLALSLAFAGATTTLAAEPEAFSTLLGADEAVEAPSARYDRGFCQETVACPGGQYTAYCQATGPYTACGRVGAYAVRCVAWTASGRYTVASQACP